MIGFRNIRHFGMYMSILTILSCLPILLTPKKPISQMLSLGLISIFSCYFYITGGRAATYITIILLLAIALIPKGYKFKRLIIILAGVSCGMIATDRITPENWSYDLTRAFGTNTMEYKSIDAATSGRLTLWNQSLKAIQSKPILGSGAGEQPKFGPQYNSDHPHNIILQFILDWGLVGAIIFIVSVIAFYRHLWRKRALIREDPISIIATAILLYLLMHSMVSGALFMRLNLIIAAIAWAIIFSRTCDIKTTSTNHNIVKFPILAAAVWVTTIPLLAVWVSTDPTKTNIAVLTNFPLLEMKTGGTEWRLRLIDQAGVNLTKSDYAFLRKHCSEKTCEAQLESHRKQNSQK